MEVVRDLPKVSASMTLEIPGMLVVTHIFEGDTPKEVMDAYEQVVGNGLAKVSVSADMSIKDFGTGASAMVSVSLTCNQDGASIEKAIGLAANLARGFAMENRQRAENELAPIIEQKKLAATPRY